MAIPAAAEFLFCRFRKFREIRGFLSDRQSESPLSRCFGSQQEICPAYERRLHTVASWLSKTYVCSISALLTQIDQPDGFRTQQGSDPHTARVRSVPESAGACESTPAAGDCKRELLPRAAPRSQRWHSGMARQGHSRMRVGQVADAMRVRAGVAPRVASSDPAASKGKSAGGASFGKRRVGQEERCAAPHARAQHFRRIRLQVEHRGYVVVVMVARALVGEVRPVALGYGRGKFFLAILQNVFHRISCARINRRNRRNRPWMRPTDCSILTG